MIPDTRRRAVGREYDGTTEAGAADEDCTTEKDASAPEEITRAPDRTRTRSRPLVAARTRSWPHAAASLSLRKGKLAYR